MSFRNRNFVRGGALFAVLMMGLSCSEGSTGVIPPPPPGPPPPPPQPPPPPPPPVNVVGGFDRTLTDVSIAPLNSTRVVHLNLTGANSCTVTTLANTASYNTSEAPNGIGDKAIPGADPCKSWTIQYPSTKPHNTDTLYVRLRATNTAPGSTEVTEILALPLSAPVLPIGSRITVSPTEICSGTTAKITVTSTAGPIITSMNTPYSPVHGSYMGTTIQDVPMKFLNPTSAEIYGSFPSDSDGSTEYFYIRTPGIGLLYWSGTLRTNVMTASMSGGWYDSVLVHIRGTNDPACRSGGLVEEVTGLVPVGTRQHGAVTAKWFIRP